MTSTADPAFQQALDKLMVQVNRDNILAVGQVFHNHADELRKCLRQATVDTEMHRCGGDPVSGDVLGDQSFGGKIKQLLEVHWAHCRELEAVVAHLRGVARDYGHTEDEIAQSLGPDAPR